MADYGSKGERRRSAVLDARAARSPHLDVPYAYMVLDADILKAAADQGALFQESVQTLVDYLGHEFHLESNGEVIVLVLAKSREEATGDGVPDGG